MQRSSARERKAAAVTRSLPEKPDAIELAAESPARSPLAWTGETPFYQAGLQGYSDAAMRIIARRFGSPYCVTEAIVDQVLLTRGRSEENARLDPEDHPIAGQLMGSQPETMAEAARRLVELGYDVVDVNLACPVKKMGRRCRGGLLLSQPDEAREVLAAVRGAVAGAVPTTVKLRRGFDDGSESKASFLRIFDAVVELGYASATVHARTVRQKYAGGAEWSSLRDLVERYASFPICGSGDIFSAQAIFDMIAATGVRAVSVARGAIGNPWIFREARALLRGEEVAPPNVTEQGAVLAEQYRLAERFHDRKAACRLMRKIGIKFAEVHRPNDLEVKRAFIAVRTTEDWWGVLSRWYG